MDRASRELDRGKKKTDQVFDALDNRAKRWSRNFPRQVDKVNPPIEAAIRQMFDTMNNGLEPLGITPVQFGVSEASGGGDGGGNPRGYASGGLMRVAGRGLHDTVPITRGDIAAMVAPQEDLIVANRHQRPLLDAAVANTYGVSGLPGFFSAFNRPHHAPNGYATGGIVALGRQLQAEGYEVGEHPAFGGVDPVHSAGSYHYSGQALDINDDVAPYASGGGEPGSLDALYARLKRTPGVVELLWQVADHYDHLHVALGDGAAGLLFGGLEMPDPLKRMILNGPDGAVTEMGQAVLDKVRRAANAHMRSAVDQMSQQFGAPGGSASDEQVREWLAQALRITGQYSPSNLEALYGRAMQESGGDPRAINLWDSNAAAGTPSKGLLQTIDPTFDAYKMDGYGNIWNPIHNAVAAIRYMLAEYGHIVGPSSTGYAQGGFVKNAAGILLRHGFDHKATAGILGNAWGESNWNTTADDGAGNGGLFGFTTSPVSYADMKNWAASKDMDWRSIKAQVQFMLHHGQPTGLALRNQLNELDSIPETTELFMSQWERPGIPRLDARIDGAFKASAIMRELKLGRNGGKGKGGDKDSEKIVLPTGGALPGGGGGEYVTTQEQIELGEKRAAARRRRRWLRKLRARGIPRQMLAKDGRLVDRYNGLQDDFEQASTRSTWANSPGGEIETEEEIAGIIAILNRELEVLRERRKLLKHGIRRPLEVRLDEVEKEIKAAIPRMVKNKDGKWVENPLRANLGALRDNRTRVSEAIADATASLQEVAGHKEREGGQILQVKNSINDYGGRASESGAEDSEISDLLRQQLLDSQREAALAGSQFGIFKQFLEGLGPGMPYIGAYAMGTGGKRVGRTGLAVLHEDEVVTPDPKGAYGRFASQGSAGGSSPQVTLVMSDKAGQLVQLVDARIDGRTARIQQQIDSSIGRRSRQMAVAPGR